VKEEKGKPKEQTKESQIRVNICENKSLLDEF
jgi:hypothetical protein